MKKISSLLLVIIVFSFFSLFYFQPSKAQTSISDIAVVSSRQENFAKLIESAEQNGKVRVIVGVRTNFDISDGLHSENIESRKEEIKQAQDKFESRLSTYNLKPLKYQFIPYLAMSVTADALREMKKLPDVVSIEKDEMLQPSLAESVAMVGGVTSWNAGYTANGQTIAVIDTGVDKTHPMFQGKIVSEACYSVYDNNTVFSTCNGNVSPNPTPEEPGFIAKSTAVNSGLPCNPNNESSLLSDCAHGTHVAGIAAGRTTNFAGVARNAGIIAINASSVAPKQTPQGVTFNSTTFFNSALLLALERVFELRNSFNIASVNMSLGGKRYFANCDADYPSIKNAVDNLRAVGIATIIASGNDSYTNSMGSPACISSAISVGSVSDGSLSGVYTDQAQNPIPTVVDRVSLFSNSASFLNLLAPGDGITSSVPSFASQTGYKTYGGTSQAAPHVAGAWAVLKQRNPNASVSQILNILTNTGTPIVDSRNNTTNISKPRIRIDAALSVVGATCLINQINIGQTINGQLISASDCSYSDSLNHYFDSYTFSGTAGQQIAISMNSIAIDTNLRLLNSNNQEIASNDDGGGGTNSRIPATSGFFTLPATGNYRILASSFNAGESGAYTIALTSNCSYALNQTGQSFSAAGGTGTINVTTGTGCAWSSGLSNVPWITTFVSGNGTGSGSVTISVAANNSSASRSGTITIAGQTFTVNQAGVSTSRRVKFDFDGDGKTDLSIFRPAGGEWWYLRSSDGGNHTFQFGNSSDRLVPADFTGDGKTDVAVFRPSTNEWFVLRSENNSFFSFPFGANGDVPVPADYDGDGRADAAIFRPSNQTWFISRSSGGTTIQQFGVSGDVPVTADYDGDGKSDIAIYRPSQGQWWLWRSSLGVIVYQFGVSTDKAVQGDYTGDGRADVAFFRPQTNEWFILRSENNSFFSFPFGASGDIPSPGDYDGDGKIDAAVFRPSNSTWFANRSTSGTLIQGFGISGDKPIPNVFVP